jgi:hypothetical protein
MSIQINPCSEDDKLSENLTEIGSLSHVSGIHSEILKMVSEIVRGKTKMKEKLLMLRDKFPHYFQSISLYNQVVSKLNSNNVLVANRQLIHELFDWCKGVDGEKNGIFFYEIENISIRIIKEMKQHIL